MKRGRGGWGGGGGGGEETGVHRENSWWQASENATSVNFTSQDGLELKLIAQWFKALLWLSLSASALEFKLQHVIQVCDLVVYIPLEATLSDIRQYDKYGVIARTGRPSISTRMADWVRQQVLSAKFIWEWQHILVINLSGSSYTSPCRSICENMLASSWRTR